MIQIEHAGAETELASLDAHALGEGDEEIGEDVLAFLDGDMAPVFVAATGKDEIHSIACKQRPIRVLCSAHFCHYM